MSLAATAASSLSAKVASVRCFCVYSLSSMYPRQVRESRSNSTPVCQSEYSSPVIIDLRVGYATIVRNRTTSGRRQAERVGDGCEVVDVQVDLARSRRERLALARPHEAGRHPQPRG